MSGDERELRTAWQRHVGTGDAAERWFDEVTARHRAPGRHYHDLRHVIWVVRHGRELAVEAVDPPLDDDLVDAVVAAACFHDAVYDATRPDNEPASAALARRALGELDWPADAIDLVASMIDATAHTATLERTDAATEPAAGRTPADLAIDVLVAADLGVLAAEPARYGDYVRAVRREYRHLDDETWRDGRAAFVASMLERDHLFPPSLTLGAWERRARANLVAELAALRG